MCARFAPIHSSRVIKKVGGHQMMTRRQIKDHQRYMDSREERKAHQREYYKQNREMILLKKKQKLMELWAQKYKEQL